MISFYPGPSKIYDTIPQYLQDACNIGILSENHRSEAFVAVSKKCIETLKDKLRIPSDYAVFFASSATECWHIIANAYKSTKGCHIYNGAFGEKWYQATVQIKGVQNIYEYDKEREIDVAKIPKDAEIICLTHNETSNGTAIAHHVIHEIRTTFQQSLIVVDATSSLGGIDLKIQDADIWFASVQKCFGLPAGLGLLICSREAINKACVLGDRSAYNSLLNLEEKMTIWQTPYTPNVLAIYLLSRVLDQVPFISEVNAVLKERAIQYYDYFENAKEIELLIKNKKVRSETVIALESTVDTVADVKLKARQSNLIVGNGYGKLAKTTFRIANFPAILPEEIAQLKKFLKAYIE